MSATDDRKILAAKGHNPRVYVPGSLVISGGFMTWTEKCRARCRHNDAVCHMARSGTAPAHAALAAGAPQPPEATP